MKFEIITLFPDYFGLSLQQSLLGKAAKNGLIEVETIDLRKFATDKHRTVDDTPYGGGGGMVLKIEPLDLSLESLGYVRIGSDKSSEKPGRIILTSAAGLKLNQKKAIELSLCERVTIICGHYLGVDERILDLYDIEEMSIGEYVLTGGEPAAMVMVDAIARLIPKVLGNFESALNDSYMDQPLGAPCYTRPDKYRDLEVPKELLSGDHKKIKEFRLSLADRKGRTHQPVLVPNKPVTEKSSLENSNH